jgi:hypothetical protein
MLKFNGEELQPEQYMPKVRENLPRGKDKTVTFSIVNARPYRRLSDRGITYQLGGEESIYAFDSVNIEIKTDTGVRPQEGVLQYYKTANKRQVGNSFQEILEPTYLHFIKHSITFDASKDPSLFYYLLVHSEMQENVGTTGKVAKFKFMRPAESARKTVADIDLEIEALNSLKGLRQSNKKQLRNFYETIGGQDWEEKTGPKATEEDWSEIMAPLYDFCKKSPAKALEYMNDAALEIGAKVQKAVSSGLIKVEGDTIYWGDQVPGDPKTKKIARIPKGKVDSWQEWFGANYLRSEPSVMSEINSALEDITPAR